MFTVGQDLTRLAEKHGGSIDLEKVTIVALVGTNDELHSIWNSIFLNDDKALNNYLNRMGRIQIGKDSTPPAGTIAYEIDVKYPVGHIVHRNCILRETVYQGSYSTKQILGSQKKGGNALWH